MATPVSFHAAAAEVFNGGHNLGADTLKIYLTNTTPSASADAVKADLAEITAGNGYVAGGVTVTVTSSSQTGGTYTLVGDAPAITASGGSVGPFRYAVMYNDTTTGDKLLCYWDYGSSITLADGESLDFVEGANLLSFNFTT